MTMTSSQPDEHRLGFLRGFFGSDTRVETYLQMERERDDLRAENEQLRTALEKILEIDHGPDEGMPLDTADLREIARAALTREG
jgi:hypothetical protein